MKLKFNDRLEYQSQAMAAITGLFEGQPRQDAQFTIEVGGQALFGTVQHDKGFGNALILDQEALWQNLQAVQTTENLPQTSLDEFVQNGLNFTVEMETGTGKTYVYLRSIFELHKHYGFTKFVIVVPSVPIREGVVKSIEIMREHFEGLYQRQPFGYFLYDSKNLGKLRTFATSNAIQIMVINIQAFQKDLADSEDLGAMTEEQLKKLNVIYRENDKLSGERPIDFIRASRPVVILDEPQNMESDKRDKAIANLNPLCTLRFSATHKNLYNQIFKLDPIQAYDRRLVKQIEVASIVEDSAPSHEAFVKLLKVDNKNGIKASVEINVGTGANPKRSKVTLKQGDDLAEKSKGRQEYAGGWKVTEIDATPGNEGIEFSNGNFVQIGASEGGNEDELIKAQLEATIEEHLKKEKDLRSKGIKVLSLIFLDRVADYRIYEGNETRLGQIGVWFEEIYNELIQKPRFSSLNMPSANQVHNGYFSADKKGKLKDTKGTTADDEDTYALIMRDKERLLDQAEPLRFIFSHSALREGWDNPNVFQICTLRRDNSEIGRRQTIGRGLRLAVNQQGERVHDDHVNRLTVIANESYEKFAKELQTEYEKDLGIQFGVVGTHVFAKLMMFGVHDVENKSEATVPAPLGQEKSEVVYQHLQSKGYLDKEGKLTEKFKPNDPQFDLEVPEFAEPIKNLITDKLKEFVFSNRIVNARKQTKVSFNRRILLDEEFAALWAKISPRTRYRVNFETSELVKNAVDRIQSELQAHPIASLHFDLSIHALNINQAGIEAASGARVIRAMELGNAKNLPDLLAYLQNETSLTRSTLVDILVKCGHLDDCKKNPQAFLTVVTREINKAMGDIVLKGLSYEKTGDQWEMYRIEEDASKEIMRYMDNLYKVQNTNKYPFDHVEFDSEVERKFAEQLDANEEIRVFMKLPHWFKIDTPVGAYNPDWAFARHGDETLYLVRETKSSLLNDDLRKAEVDRINCGRKHFEALGVDYNVVTKIEEALV